ncbi:hypothetical protein BDQ17DRAFT_795398 [Cyathus striatus]|nr:hypothetical protein BDQ17DRAFT_795398 [Cyathus striatus]
MLVAKGQVEIKKAGSTLLQMEIRGMDCAECVPKVARVLARLPSVTAVEIDYFSGSAQLRYDPETISNDSVVTFLARGTGFYVKDITGTDPGNQTHFTLPISFQGSPPGVALDKYNISKGSDGIWNISFRIVGEQSVYPERFC